MLDRSTERMVAAIDRAGQAIEVQGEAQAPASTNELLSAILTELRAINEVARAAVLGGGAIPVLASGTVLAPADESDSALAAQAEGITARRGPLPPPSLGLLQPGRGSAL